VGVWFMALAGALIPPALAAEIMTDSSAEGPIDIMCKDKPVPVEMAGLKGGFVALMNNDIEVNLIE
jgi:hypothetical protein